MLMPKMCFFGECWTRRQSSLSGRWECWVQPLMYGGLGNCRATMWKMKCLNGWQLLAAPMLIEKFSIVSVSKAQECQVPKVSLSAWIVFAWNLLARINIPRAELEVEFPSLANVTTTTPQHLPSAGRAQAWVTQALGRKCSADTRRGPNPPSLVVMEHKGGTVNLKKQKSQIGIGLCS